MRFPQHVALLPLLNDCGSMFAMLPVVPSSLSSSAILNFGLTLQAPESLGSTIIAVAGAPNDELPAMVGRATHAQAAVNLRENPSQPPPPAPPPSYDFGTGLQARPASLSQEMAHEHRHSLPGGSKPPPDGQRHERERSRGRTRHTPRISFQEFCSQSRLHRFHEHKVELLRRRQDSLRKSIALSMRLRRVGSGIHDGLTELSDHGDKAGFVRVYQHLQSLIEVFPAHWKRNLDNPDPLLENDAIPASLAADFGSFVPKLSASSRSELFAFIRSLRSSPQFLLDRIKSLSPSHLAALSNSLKPREIPVAEAGPFQKPRSSQRKRLEAFSNGLEDHATSFERSNPLSFLLYNVFGTSLDPLSPEYILRQETWSSICASLFVESQQTSELDKSRQAYRAFVHQILSAFATMSTWRVKERLELFLMDTLQKGAFLLENPQSSLFAGFPQSHFVHSSSHFGTQEAEDFFNKAVLDLFGILNDPDGGLPDGALRFASAVLRHVKSEQDQSSFLGIIFEWFLYEFLRIHITYPENEKMLLQYHISKEARTKILHHLWKHAATTAWDVLAENPCRFGNAELVLKVINNIKEGLIETHMPSDPYEKSSTDSADPSRFGIEDLAFTPFVVASATDIVGVIDSLFPPPSSRAEMLDPFISSSATTFNAQYSHTATRLDKLRREIILLTDLATQPRLLHACQENWVLLLVDRGGKISEANDLSTHRSRTEVIRQPSPANDCVQLAALKLVDRHTTPFGTPSSIDKGSFNVRHEGCLEDLFQKEFRRAQTKADSVDALRWHQALESLHRDYPLSTLVYDDSRVLAPMFEWSQSAQKRFVQLSDMLESNILDLRSNLNELKDSIYEMSKNLAKIRTKMWYGVEVINSNIYEDARNISSALNNMVIPTTDDVILDGSSISSRGRRPPSSSSSSLLDQPRDDTMNILKAPSEHGGPKKLADSQLKMTRKWLERNSVDNFCKGEERIHRFCMEIKMASKKLVGESMLDGPVLWASDLFAKEKSLYESNIPATGSGQMSTRAPSVISEVPSSTWNLQPTRSSHRGFDPGPRSHLFDSHSSPGRKSSFHSLGSNRPPQDQSGGDRSSSGGSPGRTFSATTTTESMSSFFSHPQSFSQSATSLSVRSRAPSTYNEAETAKLADQTAREKAKFLESQQHDLLCLLLSDLGSPVWSCGSETDAWLQRIFTDEMIQRRIRQRLDIEKLVSKSNVEMSVSTLGKDSKQIRRPKRSRSAAPRTGRPRGPSKSRELVAPLTQGTLNSSPATPRFAEYSYAQGYEELLSKLTQEINPLRKLQALADFKKLALAEAQSLRSKPTASETTRPCSAWHSVPNSRRSSFDPMTTSGKVNDPQQRNVQNSFPLAFEENFNEPEEAKIVQILKDLLMKLRPKTLFRDLQYISAFVSSDTLANTESGKAFLHFGLAALAYKADVCRSMVDVADRIMAKDLIKRKSSPSSERKQPSLLNIAEFWIFAAREGNAVAQRELASLYLTCPERIPIVSLPLSLSSETFKNEMMWRETEDVNSRSSRQKLCLALHWMQQAAGNGDEVAKNKMKKREMEGTGSGSSIR